MFGCWSCLLVQFRNLARFSSPWWLFGLYGEPSLTWSNFRKNGQVKQQKVSFITFFVCMSVITDQWHC